MRLLRLFTIAWIGLLLLTGALYADAPRLGHSLPPQLGVSMPYCLCWHTGEECTCGGTCPCPGHRASAAPPRAYSQAVWEAKRTGKPLVVWIGVTGQEVPGAVTVSVDYLPGYPARLCMVSRDAEHVTAKLAPSVTTEQIRVFLFPPRGIEQPFQPMPAPVLFQPAPLFQPALRGGFGGGGGGRGGGC